MFTTRRQICSGPLFFASRLRDTDLIRFLNSLHSIFGIFSFFFLSFVTLYSIEFGRFFFGKRKKNHFSHSPRVWFECTFSFWQMTPRANIDKEFFIIKYIKKERKKNFVFKRFGHVSRYTHLERIEASWKDGWDMNVLCT